MLYQLDTKKHQLVPDHEFVRSLRRDLPKDQAKDLMAFVEGNHLMIAFWGDRWRGLVSILLRIPVGSSFNRNDWNTVVLNSCAERKARELRRYAKQIMDAERARVRRRSEILRESECMKDAVTRRLGTHRGEGPKFTVMKNTIFEPWLSSQEGDS